MTRLDGKGILGWNWDGFIGCRLLLSQFDTLEQSNTVRASVIDEKSLNSTAQKEFQAQNHPSYQSRPFSLIKPYDLMIDKRKENMI